MRKVSAVIFDIDGTLLLSNEANARAYVEAASMLGIKADFSRIRRLIGKGGDKLIPEAFGVEQSSPLGKQLDELKGKIFETRYLPRLAPAPGTRALLRRLHREGVRLAVATSGDKESAEALLERAHVRDLIDYMATADEVDASKPDPDVIDAALRKLNLPVSSVIMVGDTPYDVEAAQNAGVRIIAVRCGGWSDGQLQGAAAIYDDPADILKHYEVTMATKHKSARSTRRKVSARTDAISILTGDHQRVRELLRRLDNTTERATTQRKDLLAEIENEVKVHTTVEEEIFYPAFKEAVRSKSDKEIYAEALEEHHLVDLVMPEIKSTDAASGQFGAKAKVLKDLIEHHAEEEEGEMFPKARKAMTSAELVELGKQIQSRKQDLQAGLVIRVARTAGAALGTVMNKVGKKRRAA